MFADIRPFVAMLYLIGLGLGDIKDITVKGLEIVKQCDKVMVMSQIRSHRRFNCNCRFTWSTIRVY